VTGTAVGGPIFEDTVWDVAGSPCVMIDVVHVEPGVTLTIEPGVTIMGSSDTALAVSGYLSAVGTAVDRIIFTSALDSGPGQWWGVDIGCRRPVRGGWPGLSYLRHPATQRRRRCLRG
jgi:hypothetical protein